MSHFLSMKSDIYNLLRTFSREEITGLGRFLASPYFGKSGRLKKLHKEIVKYYPLFTHINLEKENLAKKVFPGTRYNDSTMRNLLSDLHEEALHFLLIENFERSTHEKYNFLFNELKIKGLHHEFGKIIHKLDSYADEPVDWIYFLNFHFVETYKFNFSHHYTRLQNEDRINAEVLYINNSINYLIYFFAGELISHYLNYLYLKTTYNIEELKHNIEESMKLIDLHSLKEALKNDKNSFMIDIYGALVKMYSEMENDDHYFRFKKIFCDNIDRISPDEKRTNFNHLIAYCGIKMLAKKTGFDYDTEQFGLYKEMLEKEYYLDRNTIHLPHEIFRNILLRSLKRKEFTWAGNFVAQYSCKVHPQDIDNIYNYGKAYLEFYLGSFESSLNYLKEIDQGVFVYKMDVKRLTLMIYYELGYIEEAISNAKSYREFIRTNKMVNRDRQKRYIDFSKYLEKLVLYKAESYKKDFDFLKQQIIHNDSVAYKEWLLEKINEYDRKKLAVNI